MSSNDVGTKVTSDVISTLIKDFLKFAWKKAHKHFKDLDAEEAIRYRTAYEEYIAKTSKNISLVKTIIYRKEPKFIYSIYECVGVKYGGNEIDTGNICNLFDIGNKILISGTGGTGKSVLLKHLFLNTIKETDYIPVMIELRNMNTQDIKEISLYEEMYKSLKNNGFNLSKEYFEVSMNEGAYVLFLDGIDEIKSDRKEKITREIKDLSEHYSKNRYIASSRPSPGFIGWNDFCEADMMSLTKIQALDMISKIDFEERVKEDFCKEMDSVLYDKYISFASNPLLLNIMLLTFQKHSVIPESINDFYEEAFVTLFNAHDATKDFYKRDIKCKLGCDEFKLIFSYICFKSYFESQYAFSDTELRNHIESAKIKTGINHFNTDDYIDDLSQSICMLIKEGIKYYFAHRSFQEFFAAFYTCKLTDDVQSILLRKWIKESDNILADEYFTMLFRMQREKVNKIVLCPLIKEIKNAYEKDGYSIKFLRKLFDEFAVRRFIKFGEVKYSFSILMNDQYFCKVLFLCSDLNNFNFSNMKHNYTDVHNALFEKVCDNNASDDTVEKQYAFTFEEALMDLSEDDILGNFLWIKDRCEFLFEILKKYEKDKIDNRSGVTSILEGL